MKPHLKSGSGINCLVVDDEPIAREGLMEYIRQISFLNPVAQCKSAVEAAVQMKKEDIDLIFLDIQMPRITGIEFLKALVNPPLVIFTTAYPEYALEGFELDVIDYLLKPISLPRFLKAVEKAQSYLSARKREISVTDDFFFIKCNGRIERIMIGEVVYIEAMSNYVIIHTPSKKFITYITFSGIEEQLPSGRFVRIHKSYMVAIPAIQTIEGNEVVTGIDRLPISKIYRSNVMQKIEPRLIKR
jgi:two-component system, LytTR family, response regulator